jgi:hypothetical protein
MDFQALSSAQGKHYESHVRSVLQFRGWTIVNDKPMKVPGGEVDIVARDPAGMTWWIECKGSYRKQPGLLRHDTLLKCIATGWAITTLTPDRPPYMVATSHEPRPQSSGARILALAVAQGFIDRVETI